MNIRIILFLRVFVLLLLMLVSVGDSRRIFRGVVSSLLSTIVRGENLTEAPNYSSRNAWVSGSSIRQFIDNNETEQVRLSQNSGEDPTPAYRESSNYIPNINQEPFPFSSTPSAELSRSFPSRPAVQSFPILRKVQRNFHNRKVLSYLNNIKLFNKFKFKGFAITFLKSMTEWQGAGVGVKIPITPNFPNYDSVIYLPRVVATLSLNVPYCWKLGFTINVPVQVYLMLLAIAFEYANQIYESIKKLTSYGSNQNKGDQEMEEEEENELMNMFSDREVTPPKKKVSGSRTNPSGASSSGSSSSSSSGLSSSSPLKKLTTMKASSGSVKRVGVSIGYKYTAWNAKGNGWSMGPAFNYVSSLIITNKLLPFMILISVCFFSALETAFLLMYWMYEIYYFMVQQVVAVVNALWEIFVTPSILESGGLSNVNNKKQQQEQQQEKVATSTIYYSESPYYAPTGTTLPPVAVRAAMLRTAGGSNASTDFFITSNNDLSIYSDTEEYLQEMKQPLEPEVPVAPAPVADTGTPSDTPTESSDSNNKIIRNKTMKLKCLLLNMRQRYHNYAQSKLHSQLIYREGSSSSSSSSHRSLWQINWRNIEKWILTKSPVFGYSMGTTLLPFPNKGLKFSTNVNFDIQNFHPLENFRKLLESIDLDNNNPESLSKNTFL